MRWNCGYFKTYYYNDYASRVPMRGSFLYFLHHRQIQLTFDKLFPTLYNILNKTASKGG